MSTGKWPLEIFLDTVKKLEELDGPIYLDVQWLPCEPVGSGGERNNSNVVVKEFAVTCDGTDAIACLTVLPPTNAVQSEELEEEGADSEQQQQHQHRIHWDDGDITVEDLRHAVHNLLYSSMRKERSLPPRPLYVDGMDKVEVLVNQLHAPWPHVAPFGNIELYKEELDEIAVRRACPFHYTLFADTPCAEKGVKALKARHSKWREHLHQ